MTQLERKTNVEIIQLAPDDWMVLRDLKLQSLHEEQIAFGNPEQETKRYIERPGGDWRKILLGERLGGKEGERVTVFAKVRGSYVGMVSSILTTSPDSGYKSALLQHMYVAKERRGQGIGKNLLVDLINKLGAKGVRTLNLEVAETQVAAINMYKDLGFGEISRKNSEENSRLQKIHMQRII